ncbi:NADH-quinone oxidoreductase [Geotalea uraniireducens]|uniref:NADH-quinone oxidoreductase n=1 Tax=Geotalea uraniireducens TaxID=351604 RepID=A0ABM8EQG5_9BACT|nr:NADH-quinone oxidoreductase subunit NuoG [Geotalea uraniireducens]BDV44884.1 NADH-quinone oxidoreductase [Geotalea uraniireducens]
MPKLIIDHIAVEVPAGTSVLEAAKSVGIWIPHFCYHPALGSVGACRLCAVKLLDGPVKGIQMSCMLPAQDGMVVSTTDPEALKMRSLVIEWLMTNHPHDCPVCDEGGECLLQDYTVAGGHGIRRYEGKKRTHVNQDLGPYIQHEMNRCIQCYRCVRFYQEYAGGSDFGVLGSARRVYYGRFAEGALESPFSGNLVDICPTGVFTDKPARFRARYWDYEMAPSVCPWCSLGCNTVPAARYRELLKTIARENRAVNGPFLCDRGRFTTAPVNDPARPRTPLVDGEERSWDEALDALTLRLGELGDLYGPESLAVVGSSRLSLEGNILLARLAGLLGAGKLCYFVDGEEATRAIAAVSLFTGERSASMAEVRKSDCVVIFESDLRDEGPMMLLAVRQAWRNGAPVFLVGEHAPLEQTRTVAIEAIELSIIEEVPLAIFERPVIICGSRTHAADLEVLARAEAKIACLFSGPNAFGAGILAGEEGAVALAEAVAAGTVKGILAVEADIPEALLAGVPFVAAFDWQPTEAVRHAGIVLPTAAWVESAGTFVNYEGRAQRFDKAMAPGLPIRGLPARYHASPDKPAPFHPPRLPRHVPPGGELRPAWRILADLAERFGGDAAAELFTGRWEPLRKLDPESEGIRLGNEGE